MTYQAFPNKPRLHVGDLADPAQMNAAFDGLQAEIEDRSAAGLLEGVTAGMVCAIDGKAVNIGVGQAYAQGALFTGGASVAFGAEDVAGVYYVYIDSGDLGSPYKKSTVQPGAGKLLLGKVAWDGISLGDFADLRVWGLRPARLAFSVAGAVSVGVVGYTVLDRNFWIEDVRIMLADTGSAESTVVDVHVGDAGAEPASVFNEQGLRPEIDSAAADYSMAASGVPDTNRRAQDGQVLRVDVDAAAPGAVGLAVVVRGRYW